jgi:hypothetical protein
MFINRFLTSLYTLIIGIEQNYVNTNIYLIDFKQKNIYIKTTFNTFQVDITEYFNKTYAGNFQMVDFEYIRELNLINVLVSKI